MKEGNRSQWLVMETSPDGPDAPFVARIAGLGRALPTQRVSTRDLMASTRHRTGIDLEGLTGIHERRFSTGEDDSVTLATAAALDCLRSSGRRAEDMEVVISCSITKYRDGLVQWMEPATALAVADSIGAGSAVTFDVSNACAGMLTGVFILNNWIRRGFVRQGLVVSGEYISQLGRNAADHVRSIVSRELASLTLGDAGAALLVERVDDRTEESAAPVPGITAAGFTTIAEHSRLCLAYPADREPGARMFTRSQALQKAAIADIPVLLEEILDRAGLRIDEVDHVIPHQTSARAIRKGMAAVTEALGGEPRNPAVVTVDHFGNTASTTHTVALVDLVEQGRLQAGDRVALIALASGLVVGVVIFIADEQLVRSHGNHD